jgi:hypothetical protein
MRNISIFCISWFEARIGLTFGVQVCGYGKKSQMEGVRSNIFDTVYSFYNRCSWNIHRLLDFDNKRNILLSGLEIHFRILVFIKVCIHVIKGGIFIKKRHFYHNNLELFSKITLADVKIMTGNTIESNSPDRLNPTMITRHVLMSYVFIYFVRYLKEFLFFVFFDTFVT